VFGPSVSSMQSDLPDRRDVCGLLPMRCESGSLEANSRDTTVKEQWMSEISSEASELRLIASRRRSRDDRRALWISRSAWRNWISDFGVLAFMLGVTLPSEAALAHGASPGWVRHCR
jgi:hypothetical protein